MRDDLEAKLQTMIACSENVVRNDIYRALLNGYAACLSNDDLCEAIPRLLTGSIWPLSVVRNRLEKNWQEAEQKFDLDRVFLGVVDLGDLDAKARRRREDVLSRFYRTFSPPIRRRALDRWKDQIGSGSTTRWVRAIADDELMFDLHAVREEWEAGWNLMALKILLNRDDPDLHASLLPTMVARQVEGWMISKAARTATMVAEATWEAIRRDLPVTYAYLSFKLHREISDDEILQIVLSTENSVSGGRDLAIWAAGQLKRWEVLAQIEGKVQELQRGDALKYGIV
ncbi:hypothetical protein OIU34_26455 [Pararhizobium sp. BT-229]|uniref:hypothetical protein n=1 Tax=Pararhizobium sp. BT-229 TaxID=2986923 RepID=UPI0021F76811|nr:hypothetical protein [Pararhizobium sp. BT-229]MCV9965424.1 hypothetical protein [Pararhizobium sp. BT-229]